MTKRSLLLAGAVSVVLGAGAVWAAGPGMRALHAHRHGALGHFAVRHVIEELELSAEQSAQIKGILRSYRAEFHGIVERLHGVHESVRRSTHADVLDEATLRAQVGAAAEPLGDLAVLHARVRQEIAAVLTPEQRAKAERMHERWRERRHEMHEHLRRWADEFLEEHS